MLDNENADRIAIVMATFNGENYIAEQIESLIRQTYKNWQLIIRDDGSVDNTLAVIASYAQCDDRIKLITDDIGNLGYNRNYCHLLSIPQNAYIAICDQDDVWHPEKLAQSLCVLKTLETPHKTPALVHCDAIVVDSDLNVIRERFIGKRGSRLGLRGVLFGNSVQGATILMNAALKAIALHRPCLKIPYDYNLGLLAEMFGKRAFICESLLQYRQHNNNVIGANNVANVGRSLERRSLLVRRMSSSLIDSLSLYSIIKKNFSEVVTRPAIKTQLNEYLTLFESKSRLLKVSYFFKNRYTFYRRRDWLVFLALLILNEDIK
jgi:rhamnosyltransferase